jgi:hypothetical protein
LLPAQAAAVLKAKGPAIANAAKENIHMNTLKIVTDMVVQSFFLVILREKPQESNYAENDLDIERSHHQGCQTREILEEQWQVQKQNHHSVQNGG